MEQFAERLKVLRTEAQLSYMKLGQEIGTSQSAIWQWEKQMTEPTLTNIKALCKFFNVSADYLIGLCDNRN